MWLYDRNPPTWLETADLCRVLDTYTLWLECGEFQRPLLCLSGPHANKRGRRLVGQMKGPPVLPLLSREAESEECQRRENKSILSFFDLSVALSFFSIVLLFFPAILFVFIIFSHIEINSDFLCFTDSQKEVMSRWIYLRYNFRNTNMHSVLLFDIVMWQMKYVTNKTVFIKHT